MKNYGYLILSFLLFIQQGLEASELVDDFIEREGVNEISVSSNTFTLNLPNKNKVVISEIENSSDRSVLGYTVLEVVRSGNFGIRDLPELSGANPLAILHALMREEDKIPEKYIESYGKIQSKLPQGWARSKILSEGKYYGVDFDNCSQMYPFSTFANSILVKGHTFAFLSEDDGPSTRPQHWQVYLFDVYKLTGSAYDVSKFYSRVMYCNVHENMSSHVFANFLYKKSGGNWISFAYSMPLYNVGDEIEFWWDPLFSPIEPLPPAAEHGTQVSFKLTISGAYEDDYFWIGASWDKPFDNIVSTN